MDDGQAWSNYACFGYAILAADRLGYTEEQTEQLLQAMFSIMDENTLDDAIKVYLKN
jgi:hypothetical protein